MANSKRKTARVVFIVVVSVIVAVMIAFHVVTGIYYNVITGFFSGLADTSGLNRARGDELCQDIAAEGVVLLKNEAEALPLQADGADEPIKVSVFGWGATDGGFIVSGAGSGSSDDRGSGQNKKTFLDGLADQGFEYYEPLIDMYKSYKANRENGDYWNAAYPFFNLIEPDVSAVTPLIEGARDHSDTAIVVISRLGGEGQDLPKEQRKWNQTTDTSRTYLQLSAEEEDLLTAVKAAFEKVVVVINACNAMELGFLEDNGIDAAISVAGPGQSGSVAIAKILKGELTPSGKTVDTYAYDLTTAATYANSPNCRESNSAKGGEKRYSAGGYYIDYAEGIYIGYKWYETADAEGVWDDVSNEYGSGYEGVVQYPFGYGMSYTDFEWNVQSIDPAPGSTITEDTEITVTVSVTNTGAYAGADVVQLYYEPEYTVGGIEKSAKNLCAFAKTQVLDVDNGGDSKCTQVLTLSFKAEDMKSYDYNDANENGFTGYELEAGEYTVSLQTDSHTVADVANASFTYTVVSDIELSEDSVTRNEVKNRFTGDGATDAGISIDGSNTGANIQYMTRADFAGTLPAISTSSRTKDSKLTSLADNWKSDRKDTDETFVRGEANGLYLYTENASLPNEELIFALGSDYEADEWTELLNQLSVNDLVTLVEGGGYQTAKIDSIGKPQFVDLDGPSGLNDSNMSGSEKEGWTSYPVETMMAQTWNSQTAYVYGLAVGKEAEETKISGWYAPAVNIHRSPFDGRNFEYFSEDPFLSGIMGAETTRGATDNGLYCYIKHFAVNETEFNRAGLYTWLTEQNLRETYLRPFEICVKQGKANAIMSSFNRIGATWAGGSYALLTEVLRDEWGFRGTVLTDYSNGGTYMSVDQGIRAGNDCWLNGQRTSFLQNGGVNDKTSTTALSCLREAAHNIIYTYCNTYYIHSEYDPDEEDAKYTASLGGRAAAAMFPWWLVISLIIEAVILIGCGVWAFFVFKKPKAAKAVKAGASEDEE